MPGARKSSRGKARIGLSHLRPGRTEIREFHGKDVLITLRCRREGPPSHYVPGVHRLLDVKDGREIKKWPCDQTRRSLFSPDGQYLLRLVDGKLPWRVYRTDDGGELRRLSTSRDRESPRLLSRRQRVYGRDAGLVQFTT